MRGQAFEVFRLLIAAVIAGAVLMVLLNILNIIKPPSTDPADAIKNMIQKYIEIGGGGAQEVEFSPNTTIDVGAIAVKLGYSADDVCVDSDEVANILGGHAVTSTDFKLDKTKKTITYTGRSRKKAKVAVYCGTDVCGGSTSGGTIKCAVGVLMR